MGMIRGLGTGRAARAHHGRTRRQRYQTRTYRRHRALVIESECGLGVLGLLRHKDQIIALERCPAVDVTAALVLDSIVGHRHAAGANVVSPEYLEPTPRLSTRRCSSSPQRCHELRSRPATCCVGSSRRAAYRASRRLSPFSRLGSGRNPSKPCSSYLLGHHADQRPIEDSVKAIERSPPHTACRRAGNRCRRNSAGNCLQ